MAKFDMDLKKFKHVKGDDKTTTLMHEKGHIITLAHNGLSKEFQAQLKSMSKDQGNPKLEESKEVPKAHYDDGGIVDTIQKTLAPDFYKASHPSTDHPPAYPTQSKAKGGRIELAEGDDDVGYLGSRVPVKQADPRQPAPTQSVHDSKSQAQNYKEQDDYDAKQKAARSQWDPSYAEGGNVETGPQPGAPSIPKGETPYDMHLPCLNPNCKSHGTPHPNCRCYPHMASGGKIDNLRYCAHGKPHMEGCEYANGGDVLESGSRQGISTQGQDVRHGDMKYAKAEAKGRADMERHNKPKMKGLKDGGGPEDAPPMPDDVERGFHKQYMEPDKEESQDSQNKGIDKEIEDASNFAQPNDATAQAAPMAPEDQGLAAPRNQYGQEMQPAPAQQPGPDANGYQQLPQAPGQQPQGNYDPTKDNNPIQRFQNAAQYYDYKKNEVVNQGLQEGQAWLKDLQDGHVTPETYQSLFAKKDTVGKIGTLFGLLVAGAGSGLAHQSNSVMDMMKQTIDNDLHAQINSKQNAINYLRLGQQHEMNQAQIGNLNQESNAKAIANAQVRMNWSMFHDQVQKVQAMPEGPAKQQAQANLAVMNDTIQKGNYDILSKWGSAAAAAHVMGLTGGGSGQGGEAGFQNRQKLMGSGMMGDMGKNVADFETNRHIPGIQGQASRPVTQADLGKLQAHQVFDTKIRDLMSFAEQHRGSLDPRTLAQAKQKAEEATAFYNNSLDGLGMTKGRMDWLDDQIKKNPTSLIGQVLGNNARLKEIRDSNAMRRDMFISGPGGLGFPKQAPQSKSGKPMQLNPKTGKMEYK